MKSGTGSSIDLDVKPRNPPPRLGLKMSSFHNGFTEQNAESVQQPTDDQKVAKNADKLEANEIPNDDTKKLSRASQNLPDVNTLIEQSNKSKAMENPPVENLNIKLWKDYNGCTKINHSDPKRNGDIFRKKFIRNELQFERQEDRKVRSLIQESKPSQLNMTNSSIARRDSERQKPNLSPSRIGGQHSIERLKPLPKIDLIKSQKYLGKFESAPEHMQTKKSTKPTPYQLSNFLNQSNSQRNGSSDNIRNVFDKFRNVNLFLSKKSLEKEVPGAPKPLHRSVIRQVIGGSFHEPESNGMDSIQKQPNKAFES